MFLALLHKSWRRWAGGLLIVFTVIVLSACSEEYSYERVVERTEEVRKPAKVERLDNCEHDIVSEKMYSRSIEFGETVSFDREEAMSIGLQAGISDEELRELMGDLQAQASQRYGIGFQAGQSVTEEIKVKVNPHRRAVITLEWVEEWERGQLKIERDGKLIGALSYGILKDIQLDAQVQSFDCGVKGQMGAGITQAWNNLAMLGPFQHWEIAMPVLGAVILCGVLVLKRRRRQRLLDDELDWDLSDDW
jgi:hypothetical protein